MRGYKGKRLESRESSSISFSYKELLKKFYTTLINVNENKQWV